ncbi:hypothetical protein KP509_37G056100 [Ceratopteris richardii]|uniref:Uncharacterized protein n=1 Tax=Ceratopteris richardii TaxID=49495 RepID=A0A8T2QAF2_CERRI|nr:hypothetical protein KP509_37G056100 [Ceratopteris richardii]
MGKNQAYKAMQRAKMTTQTGPGGRAEDVEDGMMDGSFHSPEWHAARLASLQTSHTITWEEFKRRQKDEAKKKEEQEDDEVRLMKEYRAQLDAERASKLARGVNHADRKALSKGKKEKDKDRRKKESRRKRKHSSETESDSEDSEGHKSRRKGHEKSKRDKKTRDYKSRKKSSSSRDSCTDEAYGPVPLSSFFESCKS